MGDYGIKISSDGKDVLTADSKDLTFSSAHNSLKVARTGTIVNDALQETVSHDLGYIPAAFAYTFDEVARDYAGWVAHSTNFTALMVTNTSLIIDMPDTDYTIKYYLFYDPLQSGVTEYNRDRTDHHGAKVSQTGSDVFSVSDTNTGFSSSYQTIQARQVISNAAPAASSTITIAHNYGYPPMFFAEMKATYGGNIFYYPLPFYVDSGGVIDFVWVEVDSTNVIIHNTDVDHSADTIRIVLCTEDLSEV